MASLTTGFLCCFLLLHFPQFSDGGLTTLAPEQNTAFQEETTAQPRRALTTPNYPFKQDPDSTDPNMQSCAGPGKECNCHFTGKWDVADEFEELKLLRERANSITNEIAELDAGLIRDSMNTIQQRMLKLKDRLYSQNVSVSVRGLFDIQKSVDIMKNLIDNLDLNSTSPETIALLREELESLDAIIQDLWSSHPNLDLSDLNTKIQQLEARVSNCRENFNLTFFQGDSLPVDLEYDNWCKDYEISGVGDAITHRFVSHSYWIKGNFMKDPYPQTEAERSTIILRHFTGEGSYNIPYYRHKNYTDFISGKNAETVRTSQTKGDGYTVYRGAIYDHTRDNKINRYAVASRKLLTSVSFVPSSIKYLKQQSDTYVDLKADETGLYAIYAHTGTSGNMLIIGQRDPVTLKINKMWSTSKPKTSVCAAFMACGKLYTIDDCWSRVAPSNANKQYVYDTIREEESLISLHIPSKFGQIRQLSYNSRERVLFGWDNGHMVTYPIIWKPKN